MGTKAATTTRYFSRFYRETPGGYVRTRDVYAGDTFVASRERTGTQTAYNNYITTDHLGGVNLVTWSNHAYLADLLDPYPFGANRVANPPGSAFVEQKKYIGQVVPHSVAHGLSNNDWKDIAKIILKTVG